MTKGNRFPAEERIVRQLDAVMLRKLALNRHKDSWGTKTLPYLFKRLWQEVEELQEALKNGKTASIVDECADVANFAAQIMDKVLQYQELFGSPTKGREWPYGIPEGEGESLD